MRQKKKVYGAILVGANIHTAVVLDVHTAAEPSLRAAHHDERSFVLELMDSSLQGDGCISTRH